MLEAIGPDIWTHEAQFHVGRLHIPHRVTIMRCATGIVVHSPSNPDQPLLDEIKALGPLDAAIFPSWWHDLYLREWSSITPRLFVAPDLCGASMRMTNAAILTEQNIWPEFDQRSVDGLGVWLNEFVFFHRPSRSLIVADLVVNVDADLPLLTRTFFGLMGAYPGPKVPWFYRAVARNRQHLRERLQSVLDLDFERIIVGHGQIAGSEGRAALTSFVSTLT